MTGYRVCLDCDRKIPANGDREHLICADYLGGPDYLVGCEGYRHKEIENAIIEEDEEVPQVYKDEIQKLIEGRGAEKIYERLVESVWDYIADNCSYPMDEANEDEVAEKMQDYAWEWFRKVYLSDKNFTRTSIEDI